ncbi:concanavalin A-like lectin/glucanase [Polyplosphaeria fusca]|uniref:chitinase n=1 Tax=Polyplosphaeria fusca TaxID=682080 RepID=A0A9P4QM67_9PLEO|nr:concanavalin A-like lectin/glucanase [Polyplosphaeria fusca]
MPATFETDFTKGASAVKGWKQTAGSLDYAADGAQFTIKKQGDAPTIQSEGYVFFGYIEATVKAAAGQGIISSIVLQSEDLDEVDWEFIGTVNTEVQMNYFGKGNTTTYDRMIPGAVSAPQDSYHKYALNWTSDALVWLIDDKPIRTLTPSDANGGKNFPQTPSTVRIGIWAGGDPGNEPGVIEWAGGKTDYTKAPFSMGLASVKVTNYNPGKEYKWTDKSGSFESIEVVGKGDEGGAPLNSKPIAASATATDGGIGQSEINVPTATAGGQFNEGPGANTSCTTEGAHSTCDCGVATVTVTGPSPPAIPVVTSSAVVPPAVSAPPPASQPPFPTTGGLITDTAPAPSVPGPTAPTGGIPANGTASVPAPSQFTGAAVAPTGAAVLGLLAGAAVLVF